MIPWSAFIFLITIYGITAKLSDYAPSLSDFHWEGTGFMTYDDKKTREVYYAEQEASEAVKNTPPPRLVRIPLLIIIEK